SVAVSPSSATLQVGQTSQLTATPKDANGTALSGRTIAWSSGNTTVATVSTSGLVTANAAGSATITATSEGQNGTAAITVTNAPVWSVTVSLASPSVTVGGTDQGTAIVRDASGNILTGRTVNWSTSSSSIASVSSSGLVTGAAAGTATITATSEGQSGASSVSVTAPSSSGCTATGSAVCYYVA